jgi:hypothetical protein
MDIQQYTINNRCFHLAISGDIGQWQNQADKNEGRWFFTNYANQADKKIFFVKYANQADLKIYFVKYENQAGWNNKSKIQLMY